MMSSAMGAMVSVVAVGIDDFDIELKKKMRARIQCTVIEKYGYLLLSDEMDKLYQIIDECRGDLIDMVTKYYDDEFGLNVKVDLGSADIVNIYLNRV